jgi:hypothetical protein
VLAEDLGEGRGLRRVIEGGGRSMGIDVADVAGPAPRDIEGGGDGPDRTGAAGVRGDGVVRIGAGSAAAEQGQHAGVALPGGGPPFEDEYGGALAEDESVTCAVEGPTGEGRPVAAPRQGPHPCEAGRGHAGAHGFAAAGRHDVARPRPQQVTCGPDGRGSRGARAGGGEVGAARPRSIATSPAAMFATLRGRAGGETRSGRSAPRWQNSAT